MEEDEIEKLKKLKSNYQEKVVSEIVSNGNSWAESRPDMTFIPLDRLEQIPRVSLLHSKLG